MDGWMDGWIIERLYSARDLQISTRIILIRFDSSLQYFILSCLKTTKRQAGYWHNKGCLLPFLSGLRYTLRKGKRRHVGDGNPIF
jgi:hypothetical protein